MRPQQAFRSLVPQLSSLPEAPACDHESEKILNQPDEPSAVRESDTLDMYTCTGP